MKIFLTILALGALAHADDPDAKYGTHYTQHRTSVDTARQGMQERLSKLGQNSAYQRQYGANENYADGCTSGCLTGSSSAYGSRLSSTSGSQRSSASGLENSDYVGVGILSHNYANDESDVQQRVSARFSAGSAHEADDLQQRVVPGDLSNVQSAAYRQSSRSSRREEEEEEEEENLQTNVGAGYHDLSVTNDRYAESQRRIEQQRKESESRVTGGGRTTYVQYVPGGSSSTSYRSSARNSEAQNSESQYSEARTQRPVTVGQYVSMNVRPGTSTVLTIPVSPQDQGQQRVYASNRQGYQAGSEASRTRVQPGYQINYYPSYATDRTSTSSGLRSDSVTQRTTSYQPEKLTSTDHSRSRYNTDEIDEDEEDTQQRIQPANIGSRTSSTAGGSTNYQTSYTSSRVVPAVPVHTVESTSSQRTSEDQRRYNYQARPAVNQRVSSTRNENDQAASSNTQYTSVNRPVVNQRVSSTRNENEQAASSNTQYTSVNRPLVTSSRTSGSDGAQYGSSGTTYYTAPVSSQTRAQMQSQSQHGLAQSQYQAGSTAQNQFAAGSTAQNQYAAGTGSRTSGYGYQAYPQSRFSGTQRGSSSTLDQRYNTQALSSHSDDLVGYMSESEKLAREQQRQIAGSQSTTSLLSANEANRRTVSTANNLDAAAASYVGSTNLASRLNDFDTVENLGGTGGFKRVKSWQKQSKWASGSEYGTDGQPKSYSMLSTAEAEKHNINGAEAGYKAATTTLENDGKVSTYSIHTP